jgi:hypothetical protein
MILPTATYERRQLEQQANERRAQRGIQKKPAMNIPLS